MKSAAAVALAVALATFSTPAAAERPAARALTALDDARACAPLASGGFAVATGGGLAIIRKDGTTKTLTSLDGLPDTRVHTVVESADGLWVGTEGGAALVTIGARPGVARTVGTASVHAILASSAGVYLGTWGSGVSRLADAAAAPALVPTSASGKHVAAIAEHAGVVHVAYSDGPVARLDSGVLRPVPNTPTHGQALASSGSRVLLGDLEGVYRIEGRIEGPVVSFASVDARGLAASAEQLLVATYGAGLLAGATTSAGALRAEPGVPRWVLGVAVRGGSRCAATTEGLFVDEGSGWHKIALGGPPSNDITTLATNGERVAVGTFDHGAALYEGGAFRRITGLEPHETVNASAWQTSSRLWLGTAHGLVRVDESGTVTRRLRAADGLPSSIVRAVLVLSPDQLLVGTEEGAAFVEGDRITPLVLSKRKGAPQSLDSPMHATWALAQGNDGTLFIGTATGLYYGKAGVFQRASLSTSDLKDDWVTALAVKTAGTKTDVFVGTYSAGVTRLSFEGPGRSRVAHLAGGYVNPDGLTLRNGELYAATMDGLFVREAADDTAKWQLRGDASPGRDVTSVRVVGSALWVASRRGIAIATP